MATTLPRERILDHRMSKAYTEYVKKNKIPKELRAIGRKELFLIVRTILKHISMHLVSKTGGVMIHGLGYFFIWKIPRKMTYHQQTKGKKIVEKYNYTSNHYMYSPIFFPSGGQNNMRGWLMDNKFSSKVTSKISEKIQAGVKFRIYPHSLRKFLHR